MCSKGIVKKFILWKMIKRLVSVSESMEQYLIIKKLSHAIGCSCKCLSWYKKKGRLGVSIVCYWNVLYLFQCWLCLNVYNKVINTALSLNLEVAILVLLWVLLGFFPVSPHIGSNVMANFQWKEFSGNSLWSISMLEEFDFYSFYTYSIVCIAW